MQTYKFPFGADDKFLDVRVPDDWQVTWSALPDTPDLTEAQMRAAFANPIGTPTIEELARGKKTAVIIIDDNGRPTPTYLYAHLILEELNKGGIPDSGITFVAGVGCHRVFSGPDFRQKIGDEAVGRCRTINHSIYENLVHLGHTSRGTPVSVNRDVVEADLRIAAGGIIPHGSAGFGGGGKLILPGVCSMATIDYHHAHNRGPKCCIGGLEDNGFRLDIEEIARMAKLDVIINAVINGKRRVAGLFVGDLVAAHRKGVELARKLYAVPCATNADAAIISGYPMDREFGESMKALSPGLIGSTVKPDGSILFVSAAVDGVGWHRLGDRHRFENPDAINEIRRRVGAGRYGAVCSPNLSEAEVRMKIPADFPFFKNIDEAVAAIAARHKSPVVNLVPMGPISLSPKAAALK
ncbi:MAG: nickel-dependent lactate racemase [Chloroflexi bacterium]|nr:nickel-dependent lactate racemase [Chloroflexota bacterium]